MPIRKPHSMARALRRNMPPAERRLWRFVRNKQLEGFRFRRQHTIGPYIADFVCIQAKLAIELDGEQHAFDDGLRDKRRDAVIESQGWTVLRFWNEEVYRNIDSVLERILENVTNAVRELGNEKI